MPTATVTVLYVNPPAPGRTNGSIKTKEMEYISVKPDDLRLFEKGRRYEIEYAIKNVNGKDYYNLVRLIPNPQAFIQAAADLSKMDPARTMFITGVVGRSMGSGKFEMGDIPGLAAAADDAWERIVTVPDIEDEEIPF